MIPLIVITLFFVGRVLSDDNDVPPPPSFGSDLSNRTIEFNVPRSPGSATNNKEIGGQCSLNMFPFGLAAMINDAQLREEICEKKNPEFTEPLVCWHNCFSTKAAMIEGGMEALTSCWGTWAGRREVPATPEEWINYYCVEGKQNTWIFKNMADYCFLEKITEGFTNKTLWKMFKSCPSPGKYKFYDIYGDDDNKEGIKGVLNRIGHLFGADPSTPSRKKDLFAPPMTMKDAGIKIEMICKNNNEAMIKQQAHENDCFMRSHMDKKTDVDFCWNLMTGNMTYPKDYSEWKTFMCEQTDPFGVREGFEYCLMKKFKMTSHSECDQFHMFKTSYHIFRPELPAESVQRYHTLYKSHMMQVTQEDREKKRQELMDKKVKGVKNPWCEQIMGGKQDAKIVEGPTAKAFLEKNPLRCLYQKGDLSYMMVADLCTKFYLRLEWATNTTEPYPLVGSEDKIPQTDAEWIEFSCARKDYDTFNREVSTCIKQSVKRANSWIRETRVMSKFNPGKAATNQTSKMLKAVDFCLRN